MKWDLSIHPSVVQEIDQQVAAYEARFTGGGADFLLAVEDTLGRIERLPNAAPKRSAKHPSIRGWQVKNTDLSLAIARKFPFVLIYLVAEETKQVIVYQLWPSRSQAPIQPPPDLE